MQQTKGNEMGIWYVFDRYDCFGSWDTSTEATTQAEELISMEMKGVHIAYMKAEEFTAYVMTGKFPFSK